MKKIIVILVFVVVCLFPIFSNKHDASLILEKKLSAILNPALASELVQKNEILKLKYGASSMKFEMLPKSNLSDKMREFFLKQKPAFSGEFLTLYKKTGSNDPDVSKILRHISDLEGIEYFSNSHKEMRPLYLTSYAVKEVKDSDGVAYERIDDPLDEEVDGLQILARHVDATFGDFIYRYRYFKSGNDVGMICINTQKITHPDISLIALQPDAFIVSMAVYDLDDYILIHCSSTAKFPLIPFVGSRIKRSFSSRLMAVYNWFIDEYKRAEQGIEYSAKKNNKSGN